MNIEKTLQKVQKEIDEVQSWADDQYNTYFAPHFAGQQDLYKKMMDKSYVVSDVDLEWILTHLPLELFAVSEELSKMKTAQEVIKLHIKEVESSIMNSEAYSTDSVTRRKEFAAEQTAGERLLISVYTIISERVDKQVSLSRELIMSAKKLWDARKESNLLMPTPGNLSEYDFNK